MNLDVLELLACPADQAPLALVREASGSLDEGELGCGSCGSRFPIVAGVPRFLATASLPELQAREKEARDREYSRNEKYESEISRLPEFDAVRSALGECRSLRELDAGCGTGELIRAVLGPARAVGVDFSVSGLLRSASLGSPSVDLIEADVCRLPLAPGSFDAAVSTGMLHHLPSEARRTAFYRELQRTLKPRGRLAITAYQRSPHRRGSPASGFFDSGIFMHQFEAEELRSELARHFDVDALVPVRICLPKTYRLVKALGPWNVAWDRFWRRFRAAHVYGDLLLAICKRRPS